MSLPHSQWCNAIAEGSTAAECTCGAVTADGAVLAAEARADEAERLCVALADALREACLDMPPCAARRSRVLLLKDHKDEIQAMRERIK
jgi:hypothetical protein